MDLYLTAGKYFVPFPVTATDCFSTEEWAEGIRRSEMGRFGWPSPKVFQGKGMGIQVLFSSVSMLYAYDDINDIFFVSAKLVLQRGQW